MTDDNKIIEERSRYRSSFGATVLFSGVQLFQILIKIVKSKFVALFIGPAGMGIHSLLYSTTETISAATNLGLNTSSVKTIAAANRDGNKELIAKNITAQRRLIWITGIIGMMLCAVFAPLWSQTSFGNSDYVWPFVVVSTVILLEQLNRGELALLQGMQQRKKLAKANLIGQTLNALVTIPLYYFYGVKAIVAALVLGAFVTLIISLFYSHKLDVEKVQLSWRETFSLGREMIKLGFFLSLQYLMSTIVVWIIRNYVSSRGGVDEVGLYTAGTSIVANYLGLVFAAIATDYFPRLAATKSNEEMGLAVCTQAELTMLLLSPLVVMFLVFCKPFIILLYSEKFVPVENMMYWAVGATMLQAMSWALSHTLLAKAKPLYFFLNEFITIIWGLPIKLFFYKWWGLTGFGIATLITYALYLLQVLIVTKKLFGISYDTSIWKLFVFLNIPIIASVLLKFLLPEVWGYVIGGGVLIATSVLVIKRMNQKMDLISVLRCKLKLNKNS